LFWAIDLTGVTDDFRILFVADVVGQPGREAVKALLPGLKRELEPNVTILNGENAAGGFGLTAKLVAELRGAGADVITTGNHVFAQKEFIGELPSLENVIRPANYPPQAPGKGSTVFRAGSHDVLVMNLIGRIFTIETLDDPFRGADAILAAHPQIKIVFCDMHAEATSEKTAMGWYLDGRVSAVVGTHTHIPTADARVLPGGFRHRRWHGGAARRVHRHGQRSRSAALLDRGPEPICSCVRNCDFQCGTGYH